jgi:hypothetical protein
VKKGIEVGKKAAESYKKNKKKIDAAGKVMTKAFPGPAAGYKIGKNAAKSYLKSTGKKSPAKSSPGAFNKKSPAKKK